MECAAGAKPANVLRDRSRLDLGRKKIFEVRALYTDVTFIDEFLTPEFCLEQKLFTYGWSGRNERFEDNLELSAETLKRYRPRPAAGEPAEESAVVAAIRADPDLSAKERAALIEVNEAFVARKH